MQALFAQAAVAIRNKRKCLLRVAGIGQGFSTGNPLGGHGGFSRGHEQKPLLNSTAMILQNPTATTLIIRQWKGALKS